MGVRYYDKVLEKVCEIFLGLVKVKDASAIGISNAIFNLFEINKMPSENVIGFGVDNAATMMGNKSEVRAKLLDFISDLYVIDCSCHSFFRFM